MADNDVNSAAPTPAQSKPESPRQLSWRTVMIWIVAGFGITWGIVAFFDGREKEYVRTRCKFLGQQKEVMVTRRKSKHRTVKEPAMRYLYQCDGSPSWRATSPSSL